MLMREHWRCCYFAGKYPPESQVGLTGCEKAGWLTGRVTDVTKREDDGQHSEPSSHDPAPSVSYNLSYIIYTPIHIQI